MVPGIYSLVDCSVDDKVVLYLGSDTYVEYSYKEAIELLRSNLENA